MNWEEYADFVTKLASESSKTSLKEISNLSALGLAGETGEIVDTIKKLNYHGMPYSAEVHEKLTLEVGDVMWYITFLCKNYLHVTLQQVIDMNVEKLSKRYKGLKFTTEEFMKKEAGK